MQLLSLRQLYFTFSCYQIVGSSKKIGKKNCQRNLFVQQNFVKKPFFIKKKNVGKENLLNKVLIRKKNLGPRKILATEKIWNP